MTKLSIDRNLETNIGSVPRKGERAVFFSPCYSICSFCGSNLRIGVWHEGCCTHHLSDVLLTLTLGVMPRV